MIRVTVLITVLCLIVTSGCESKTAPVAVPRTSLEDLPLVPHPEYDNWSKFKVGTKVVRKDKLASTDGEVLLYTMLRLAEASDSGVVIETQTAIERNGTREDSDLNSVDYPAKFRLPKGMSVEQFQLPALKAVKSGEEQLSVAGKEYATEIFTFQDQSEAGPVDVTLWRSVDFPGRQLKKEIVDRKGLVLSSSTIVEHQIP
jgi:hypothetical protein